MGTICVVELYLLSRLQQFLKYGFIRVTLEYDVNKVWRLMR